MNVYGFWQYIQEEPIGTGANINKGDIIRVISKDKQTLYAIFKGRIQEFDISLFLNKKSNFIRPIRGHTPCTCKKSLAKQYCKRCDIYMRKKNNG